tara:strand:- start:7050 stop:7682 length:633 start_codon:yes stop_codon:yes gene_type:complete
MFILASGSPSRKKLLDNALFPYKSITSDFDEDSIQNIDIKELSKELSFKKAESVAHKIISGKYSFSEDQDQIILLGCDSIFEFNGLAFGKPSSKEEAFKRWEMISSNCGFLHTGHSLIGLKANNKGNLIIKESISGVVSSKVCFSKINKNEINYYINTEEPMTSAGGFKIEGIGGFYIEKIDGCYTNVMGLSLPWLRKNLTKIPHKKNSG